MILPIVIKATQEENAKCEIEVKEKLQQYLKECDSPKCKWLLSSHAHCFIGLS